jgi:hypothetical protein
MSTALCFAGPGCMGCSFCESEADDLAYRNQQKREEFRFTFADIVANPQKNEFHPANVCRASWCGKPCVGEYCCDAHRRNHQVAMEIA